jgi:hypothetical protein
MKECCLYPFIADFLYIAFLKRRPTGRATLTSSAGGRLALCPTTLQMAGFYSATLAGNLCAVDTKAEVELPERSAFHIFCHTYATWLRREAGLDTKGLVATGRWKDRKSADRYEHVIVSEEAKKASLLPVRKIGGK